MVGMNVAGGPLEVNFPIFDFSPPGGLSPVHIHFECNQKVDTEVDIQKGNVPMISRARNRGIHMGARKSADTSSRSPTA